jgi:hypothetical protein
MTPDLYPTPHNVRISTRAKENLDRIFASDGKIPALIVEAALTHFARQDSITRSAMYTYVEHINDDSITDVDIDEILANL